MARRFVGFYLPKWRQGQLKICCDNYCGRRQRRVTRRLTRHRCCEFSVLDLILPHPRRRSVDVPHTTRRRQTQLGCCTCARFSARQVSLTVESMNIVSGSHQRSDHFWHERLLPSIRSRFGELAVDHAEEGNIRLLLQPCIVYIIQRLQVRHTSQKLFNLRIKLYHRLRLYRSTSHGVVATS